MNEKLKVLHVCTVPTDKSGIPNVIFNLISNFPDDSIKFGYVSINEPSSIYKEKLHKINATLHIIERSISKPFKYIRELSNIAKNYDIIHVHGNSATMVLEMIASKIAGVKIRIAHAHSSNCNMKIIDFLARPMFYRLCNGRLACGNNAGKWLYRNRNFTIVNNGISVEKFRFNNQIRTSVRERLGFSNEYIIGNIGNFLAVKNHYFMINIFKTLSEQKSDFILLLLGEGPLQESIQRKVDELGLTNRVIFTGSVNNPEEYINVMDIIVMPSLYEGLPLTLIEEQANGLPILASDTITKDTNVANLVTFKSLSDPPESWAAKINEIVSQSSRTNEISTKAIELIKDHEYDIKIVADKLKGYYEQVSR